MPLSSGCSYDMENHHYCGLLCVCWASQMYLLCFCESLRPRNTDLTKNRTAQELHRMLTCAVKANGRHSPSRRRCASCESGLFRAQTALESQMCLLCFRETLTLRRTGRQKELHRMLTCAVWRSFATRLHGAGVHRVRADCSGLRLHWSPPCCPHLRMYL